MSEEHLDQGELRAEGGDAALAVDGREDGEILPHQRLGALVVALRDPDCGQVGAQVHVARVVEAVSLLPAGELRLHHGGGGRVVPGERLECGEVGSHGHEARVVRRDVRREQLRRGLEQPAGLRGRAVAGVDARAVDQHAGEPRLIGSSAGPPDLAGARVPPELLVVVIHEAAEVEAAAGDIGVGATEQALAQRQRPLVGRPGLGASLHQYQHVPEVVEGVGDLDLVVGDLLAAQAQRLREQLERGGELPGRERDHAAIVEEAGPQARRVPDPCDRGVGGVGPASGRVAFALQLDEADELGPRPGRDLVVVFRLGEPQRAKQPGLGVAALAELGEGRAAEQGDLREHRRVGERLGPFAQELERGEGRARAAGADRRLQAVELALDLVDLGADRRIVGRLDLGREGHRVAAGRDRRESLQRRDGAVHDRPVGGHEQLDLRGHLTAATVEAGHPSVEHVIGLLAAAAGGAGICVHGDPGRGVAIEARAHVRGGRLRVGSSRGGEGGRQGRGWFGAPDRGEARGAAVEASASAAAASTYP